MRIGDVWNGWTVDSSLGEGSFGEVFRVVRKEFGHTYESAIKVIRIPRSKAEEHAVRSEGLSEESITAYYQSMIADMVSEFILMSELKGNSNIVSYEDHSVRELQDEFGWELVIRMEMLTPLKEYLKDHTLSIRDVIQLGIDICRALETCQKSNIIHRDIKPDNIFVAKQGNFKLGDFGIARRMEMTSSEMSKKGTYTYMAPEVYKGLPYDETVDIYSLGIVLYQYLNNCRTPFLPNYPALINYWDSERARKHRMNGDPIPAPCNADSQLAEIVLKACSFDPKNRFDSPEKMRIALESIECSEEMDRVIYTPKDISKPYENNKKTNDSQSGIHGDVNETELIFDAPDDLDSNYRWSGNQEQSYREGNRVKKGGYEETTDTEPEFQSNGFVPDDLEEKAFESRTDNNLKSGHNKKKPLGLFLLIAAIIVAAGIAAIAFVGGDHISVNEVKSAEESVIYDNVDPNLPITSLRMDFENSKNIGGGIVRADVIILLSNHTGSDVTGFAFRAYNQDGDKSEIKNRDKDCDIDAPFYAEGYLPDGGNGVMISEMTISKEDYIKLNPDKNGHRLKPRCIFLTEAYEFREEMDYSQPIGRLLGPDEDESDNIKYYSVEIDNDNESPIHEGARIAAIKRDDEDSTSIRKGSARGRVDQEIPAESQGFIIDRTFNNSGLEKWPAEEYEVYVIDNEYSDGSHYYDSYREKYGK